MKRMNLLKIFIIIWQTFDILIHVFTDNFEFLRVAANISIIILAFFLLIKKIRKSVDYFVLSFHYILTILWLIQKNFILNRGFIILMTVTIISTTLLTFYRRDDK